MTKEDYYALLEKEDVKILDSNSIYQKYLDISDDTELRIRSNPSNGYTLVYKKGVELVRSELIFSITREDYLAKLGDKDVNSIMKLRTDFEYKGQVYEGDEFVGRDLVIVEKEFDSYVDAESFVSLIDIPMTEVTGNKDYYNRNLIENRKESELI
jgi:CYTH domain-containing protein